jgi:hypothetical protein
MVLRVGAFARFARHPFAPPARSPLCCDGPDSVLKGDPCARVLAWVFVSLPEGVEASRRSLTQLTCG